ncbi:adenosylcobinamide-phosphate synthase CbiB [Nisaea acidiphila]|uniref:Cobalamin biosynthesis protein CobD n=1 Tax=Nisaea acidiphila TaxID=1862145 RepID=A0A9J7ALZ4_9PROT|nr:adenosylcobinamide-phosphate synthase CbiB [Nisaea acidiphila]UUX48191.1 adenosylcobinamide-phosphate synthase CbiB [Nisaea acidiphila]
MSEDIFASAGGILFLALILDALVGDPPALWKRVPHPVVLFGNAIGWAETRWNAGTETDEERRRNGVILAVCLLVAAAALGWLLHRAVSFLAYGWLLEAAIASVFLAQRSLYDHVRAVAIGFGEDGLPGARRAVSLIVGRDPEQLDEAGVCRAAIETAAENFSDGVVAPAFWYLLAGLPGLLAYKALNTADSMIGHRNARYIDFGRAAARLDDFANLVPARISAGLFWAAAFVLPDADPRASFRATFRDAGKHRSPNAGWPEAATAGALGLRLAGPRVYGGETVEDAWMGNGRAAAAPADILRALSLFRLACLALLLAVGGCTLLSL